MNSDIHVAVAMQNIQMHIWFIFTLEGGPDRNWKCQIDFSFTQSSKKSDLSHIGILIWVWPLQSNM